ncbi:hypothetical protein G5B97_01690 [Campylobacter concisus]|uniref:hypothetical protein n=1 Tax=Campylobacter concisus TaxID=199 RepID=UPI0018A97480|nr:hypothetical protein [Campylobacter concisus]QPH98866.1 hypothetical protein G5B98_01480 [Campylobacter concisus]QPI00660.1 hypothetical protein G5B97_01690 [Campylobacter concisus]
MKQNKIYEYDVALSFAGENREYVEEVAIFLKNFGVKVFYDDFKQDKIWGKTYLSTFKIFIKIRLNTQ